jgi:hypothetical protein
MRYNKFYLKFECLRREILDFLENTIWLNDKFKNMRTDNF